MAPIVAPIVAEARPVAPTEPRPEPLSDQPTESAPANVALPADDGPLIRPRIAPLRTASSKPAVPLPTAAPTPEPAVEQVVAADRTPVALPETASSLPLIALFGLLAMGGALALGLLQKRIV